VDDENVLEDLKVNPEISMCDLDPIINAAASISSRKSSKHKSSRRKTTSLSAAQMHLSTPPHSTPALVTSPSLGIFHSGVSSAHNGNKHRRRPIDSKSDGGLPRNNSDKSVKTTTSRKDEVELEVQEEKRSWFEGMYPSYKSRNKEYKEFFNDQESKFIVDFSCAHSKDILRQGRMYISTGYICFYSKIFGLEHSLQIAFQDITLISKEKTAYLIPNAIQLTTKNKKSYFFATFHSRDSTYDIMNKLWSAVCTGEELSEDELNQIIMVQYPEEDLPDGVMARSPPPSTPVTFSLGAPSSEDISPNNRKAKGKNRRDKTSEEGESIDDIIADWMQTVPGDIVLNTVVNKSVSEVQTLYFTNSNFYFTFHKNRGTTELDVGDWETGEGEKGKTREVSYNLRINNPVGPKTSQVKEIQIERTCSTPGQIYCIDLEAFNSGVPYADSFTIRTHICVHRETEQSSRILVKAEIVFKKELWSYIKGKIESNAWNGIKSFYKELGVALSQHREDDHQVADHYAARAKPRPTVLKSALSEPVLHGPEHIEITWSGLLFLLVIIMLVVTCAVNLIVLTNMYLMQPAASQPETDTILNIDYNLLEMLPQNDKEWFQLFRAQVAQHHQVRQQVSDSLKKISASLVEAEQILEHAGRILKQTSDENTRSLETLLAKLAQTKQKMEL